MTKSDFLHTIGAEVASKELRSFATKMFIMNAFLVELRERNQEIYEIPESDINHKKEANDRLIKFIDCQIDGLFYNSLEINNMSFNISTVADFIENLKRPEND